MASIATESGGRRVLQFIGNDGRRRSLRLGKMSMRDTEVVKQHVDHLLNAQTTNTPVNRVTAAWLAGLPPKLRDRLAKVGLVEQQKRATLEAFIDDYIAQRTDVKQLTLEAYRHGKRCLLECFDGTRDLRSFTKADADRFQRKLKDVYGLSQNTANRRCGIAKQFFKAALDDGIIESNPFAGLSCTVRGNPAKFHYVTREEAAKVLDACPDAEWRLLFALARFGGLRVPSEVSAMTWDDVDWDRNAMRVTSPKTERFEGKAYRLVPIFGDLLPWLRQAFELAEPGAVHLVKRSSKANLRTHLSRIITKAGLEPWPKLWQNLRSTRETELAERFAIKSVSEWIGNSIKVASEHYLQVTDEQFQAATEFGKALQNPVQHAHAGTRSQAHRQRQNAVFPEDSHGCALVQSSAFVLEMGKAGPPGLEPGTS